MSDSDKEYGTPHNANAGKIVEGEDVEGQLEELDVAGEAKLVRKLDLFIIPVVMLLYLLSFLDR